MCRAASVIVRLPIAIMPVSRLVLIVGIMAAGAAVARAGVTTWTFSNTTMVWFNYESYSGRYYATDPDPTTIHVPSLPGVIQGISVTLNDISCQSSTEVNVKLTAPWSTYYKGGVSLMCNVGGDKRLNAPDLTLTDSALNYMAYDTPPATGTYKPSNYYGTRKFPDPCPDLNYYGSFAEAGVMDLMFPVGKWNLYCYDSYPDYLNRAYLGGGWSISLTMRYNGINIPAGSLVAAQNETPPGQPGYSSCLFPQTTGGVFASDFYQQSLEELRQRISADLALFDSLPRLATADAQYWNVFHEGDVTGPAQLTFVYDPSTLLPGVPEQDLGMWHFTDGEWVFLGGLVDPARHSITVASDSFSPFMLGINVPEPASLLVLGSLALLLRRRTASRRR